MPSLPPTTGAPLNLYVPPFDYGSNPATDFTWDVPANDNWTILNSFAQTVVLYNPTASQTVAQPGSTFLNINKALAYDGAFRFGTAAGIWDSALSRSGAGAFTLDSNTIGNAAATLKLNVLNAVSGLQVNNAAPLNHILVGDGTHYVDSATLPTGIAFYQTAQAAGVSRTQRGKINFLPRMTAVDNGGNGSTDVDFATTAVTPGTYTLPNFTVDAYGRITAASNGSLNRTTNANGSYIGYPDGTLMQWGVVNAPTSGGTLVTVAITFPIAFTNGCSLTVSGGSDPDGTNDDAYVVYFRGLGLSGATAVVRCSVNIGGSGASALSNSVPVHWQAIGW